jgi:rubrerythrin
LGKYIYHLCIARYVQRTDLIKTLEEAVKLEQRNAEELEKGVGKLKSEVIKSILGSIANDSRKHAKIYEGILRILREVGPAISEDDFTMLEKIVRTHIKMEEEMISTLNKLFGEVDDKRITYLFKYILDDEVKHHKLLLNILDLIVKKEVLTEKDVWDYLWKEVPFHGTPGG